MSETQKPTPSLEEEELHFQSEIQDPLVMQEALEEDEESSSSACSSLSCSPVSSYSSVYTLSSSMSEEEYGAAETLSPQSFGSSSSSMVSPRCIQSVQGSHGQTEGQAINSLPLANVAPCFCTDIDGKVSELVEFLLLKYRVKEQTTKEEMLNTVIREYQDYYPVIFCTATRYMVMIFGIELKVVHPCVHSYVLVPALDLTYDGMLSDIQGIPKTGLLMMVLWIIFKEGSCVRKEVVWSALNSAGVFDDRYLFIYAHTWKLITDDFVQEGYLLSRQVPHSDPEDYEFLWGPRAHAETNPMKFLMFLLYINTAYPSF